MDILTGLNRAMDYIETNICNDVDIKSAARTTPYSAYHLQKIFGYLADMSLVEYIRRRKMTLAALELQSSPVKVTDLAFQYGYDNLDSFSRCTAQCAKHSGILDGVAAKRKACGNSKAQ